MNKYNIEVKETLSCICSVEAHSLNEAIQKIQKNYHDEKIVLDSQDFVDVEFNAMSYQMKEKEQTKSSKDRER